MLAQHGTLTLSRSRFLHNLRLLRERLGPRPEICATIKANAYGHGVEPVATLLREAGVKWVCVYTLQEAAAVARLGEGFEILVLSPVVLHGREGGELVRALGDWGERVRMNVTDAQTAQAISDVATVAGRRVSVHVQVDAGLTRAGVSPTDAASLAGLIASLPGVRLEGLFAHFSHGDVPGHETITRQYARLLEVAGPIKRQHPGVRIHLQNSGGAWHVDPMLANALDMVRIGIAMYGLQPSMSDLIGGLQPVAQVTAPILAIHERPAGTGVGYGHTFVTARASHLAIVPVGYADGYPRHLSNKSVAQVGGREAPVVGRVSMDQIILDVTDVSGVQVGDEVVVISNEPGRANALDRMADAIGTIGYELATHLGERLVRVVGE